MVTTPTPLPTGPKGLPVIGSLLDFQYRPLRFFRELEQRYGRMATVHIGKQPLLFCFRPEHIRYFLTENPRNFVKPGNANDVGLKLFLGDGLLTIDGDHHRQQRRLVQPAFHKHRVDSYATIMTRYAQETIASWQPDSVVNMASEMQYLTLRIITKTLFNVDSIEQTKKLGHAFDVVISGGPPRTVIKSRIRSPFASTRELDEASRTIDTFIYGLIEQRRKTNDDTGDVLSMLLQAQQNEPESMTDKQIHDHVLTFVAAGHETAQNTLSWTFYLLSQHPHVRAKLLAELQTVLAGRVPTLDDLPKLPYLEGVINESWRFYPPAWRQARMALEDFELDGKCIPAGTITILSQWILHNLPDIWGDPENFRPERWDKQNAPSIPQGAYFPFGLGPRICIGMPFAQLETKLLLATILQHYIPQLKPRARIVFQPLVTLRPKYGMPMRLETNNTIISPVSTTV
ncbi:cytochrome P450 [Dictyobacter alpinus]|uniref:Cytochrome P450 n=1 Tax=Dictyobacter alpinus TaxID=2014873 RepID=A0A402BG43_9CHLR|nr:cytochrome P450 [Dictyobacter alpinus]GCE30289.1 cytochrome P450 [Dictyobacter alpinus]